MDRETRDPFDLLDEIEKTLALDTAPVTWPIGRGKDFAGTYNLAQNTIRRLDEEVEATPVSGPEDKLFDELLSQYDVDEWREEVELARDGLRPFDLAAFRRGPSEPGLLRQCRCAISVCAI